MRQAAAGICLLILLLLFLSLLITIHFVSTQICASINLWKKRSEVVYILMDKYKWVNLWLVKILRPNVRLTGTSTVHARPTHAHCQPAKKAYLHCSQTLNTCHEHQNTVGPNVDGPNALKEQLIWMIRMCHLLHCHACIYYGIWGEHLGVKKIKGVVLYANLIETKLIERAWILEAKCMKIWIHTIYLQDYNLWTVFPVVGSSSSFELFSYYLVLEFSSFCFFLSCLPPC